MIDSVLRPDGGTTSVEIVGAGWPVVLAHGAGAGREHPFMTGMRDRLAGAGFRVACFDYPYREEGRRAPGRFDPLVACHRAVYEHVAEGCGRPPFLVGKSMGGRIGSHLAVAAPGWVFLGYPLVPVGRTEPRDVSHLASLGAMLFVQGERDALAPIDLITAVVAGIATAELVAVADADHGFRVPRRAGIDAEGMLDHVATVVVAWLRQRGGGK